MKTESLLLCVISMMFVVSAARAAEAPAAQQPQGQYDKTWRWGALPVPKLAQAPTVDGTIDAQEWSRATLVPPLVRMDPLPGNGLPPRTRQWVWIGYTDDALYVAWRQDLPEAELPVEPKITNERDRCEGNDNTCNIWFDTKGTFPNNFNVAGNAASQIYDRRHDDGSGAHWNGNLTYKSRILPTGWEGELKFPFSEMSLKGPPAPGTRWPGWLYSAWRKGGTRLFAWPYTIWRPNEAGYFVFVGDAPGVRFETALEPKLVEGSAGAEIKNQLYRRTQRTPQSYNVSLADAVSASSGEGATWESFDKVVKEALQGFQPATEAKDQGEYLARWEYVKDGKPIASGTQAGYVAAPLELHAMPYLLVEQKLEVRAESDTKDAKTVEISLEPGGQKQTAPLKAQQAVVSFTAAGMKEGDYVLAAEAKDADQKVIGKATEPVKRPPPPTWWTNKFGLEPKVPPPWTPVKAEAKKVAILGREYAFDQNVAIPTQVTTKGQQILAAPMAFFANQPWDSSKLELAQHDEESATYKSESKSGNLTLRVTSKVDFDGFTMVDLDILGDGSADKLDFVIPFKKEHALLLQNYMKAPGPGSNNFGGGGDDPNQPNPYRKGKRYVGLIPEKLQTPPMITTWIGTDHYGLEWSCDSSRGWAMGKPNQAMETIAEGDQVKLTIHLISKPVKLAADKPRHIRFGLIATPSKTLLPYMQKARIYDDISVALMPNDWAGHPCWHAPITDPKITDKMQKWMKLAHENGQKVIVNGGWNITADHADWEYWGKEMTTEPLQNVSWYNVKQFAACYNSPYKEFLPNSFGYNAKLVGIDGIRFDTVVPSYECKSLVHDCGWTDDDGNLWGTESNFAARDAWKRIYRVFHGEEVKEGCVYVPVAAGPIMAVHSFADVHEIGEGFYMHAKTLKEAYPPDMVRAIKNGEPYGLRSQSNLKGSPLWVNERIAALLPGNGDPRFGDYRGWKPDYTAQANPGSNIMEAWEWVDRWVAQFMGYWENSQYLTLGAPAQGKMVYGSFWLNRDQQRVLLVVSNYEPEPITDLPVKINFGALGLSSQLFAEDAITSEPVAIAEDGTIKLGIYGQRYRLIRIGRDKPAFAAENLGPNVLKDVSAELTKAWQVAVPVEPNSTYLLTAQLKMDKPMGSGTESPNANGSIGNFVAAFMGGEDIECQAAKLPHTKLVNDNYATGPVPYRRSPHYANQSMQQYWEQTPGWMTIHIPYGTGPSAKTATLEFRVTGKGEFVMKDLQVRKVK